MSVREIPEESPDESCRGFDGQECRYRDMHPLYKVDFIEGPPKVVPLCNWHLGALIREGCLVKKHEPRKVYFIRQVINYQTRYNTLQEARDQINRVTEFSKNREEYEIHEEMVD